MFFNLTGSIFLAYKKNIFVLKGGSFYMKKRNFYIGVSLTLMIVLGGFSVQAEDINPLLESELTEMRDAFAQIAGDAVNDEVKNCILNESNSVIDSKEFQAKLADCIESETKPKTVKGLTDMEAQCFSLRYGLLRSVTDKCAPKY